MDVPDTLAPSPIKLPIKLPPHCRLLPSSKGGPGGTLVRAAAALDLFVLDAALLIWPRICCRFMELGAWGTLRCLLQPATASTIWLPLFLVGRPSPLPASPSSLPLPPLPPPPASGPMGSHGPAGELRGLRMHSEASSSSRSESVSEVFCATGSEAVWASTAGW